MAKTSKGYPVGGDSKVVPLGAGQQSSNAWLGIDSRVEDGTTGSRPEMSARYGGERDTGEFFKGKSVGAPSKEMNSGNAERESASSGQYGPGASAWQSGGVGSRENMTYGGDRNQGKYVGEGVNSTKDSSFDGFFSGLPSQMGNHDLEHGTDRKQENMQRAQKGIGGARVKLPKNKD